MENKDLKLLFRRKAKPTNQTSNQKTNKPQKNTLAFSFCHNKFLNCQCCFLCFLFFFLLFNNILPGHVLVETLYHASWWPYEVSVVPRRPPWTLPFLYPCPGLAQSSWSSSQGPISGAWSNIRRDNVSCLAQYMVHLSYWVSLKRHNFKGNVVGVFKATTKEHQTLNMRSLLDTEPWTRWR